MSKIRRSGLAVQNHTERVVFLVMRRIFHTHPEICGCPVCYNDIAKLSLNKLKTMYTLGKNHYIRRLEDVDENFQLEVMNQVYRAIKKVSANPKHDGNKDLTLHNHMEDLLFESLEDIVTHGSDFCVCQLCVEKIFTLALERLPAKYVSSPQGRVYSGVDNIDPQLSSLILTNLYEAIKQVKLRPPH